MTKDELERILRRAWLLQQHIDSYVGELQRLRDNANKITPAYSLTSGGSGNGQKIENAVIKIADMERLLNASIAKLMDAQQTVHQYLELVDDPVMKLVLHNRYLNFHKWERIAADLGYSWQHVHRLHSQALINILKKLDYTKNR